MKLVTTSRQRQSVDRRRAQGQCARCGVQTASIPGPWRCQACAIPKRIKERERRLQRCGCGCGRVRRRSQVDASRIRPFTPGCYRQGATAGHVAIAERALGKCLPKGAQVHHVDGVKHNNDNANLVICQDQAYHRLLHARALVVRAGGNPNTQKICTRCRQVKQLDDFYRNASHSTGRYYICRACQREDGRARRKLAS